MIRSRGLADLRHYVNLALGFRRIPESQPQTRLRTQHSEGDPKGKNTVLKM